MNEELKKAAEEYANKIAYCGEDIEFDREQSRRDFLAGANWQKEQDNYDTIFWKGIQYARKQMMEEAVEGRVISNDGISFPVSNEIHRLKLIEGDKVRIIIVKEN